MNLRESLNQIDHATDNEYDLRSLYDATQLSDKQKKKLSSMIEKKKAAKSIYKYLNEAFLKNNSTKTLFESVATKLCEEDEKKTDDYEYDWEESIDIQNDLGYALKQLAHEYYFDEPIPSDLDYEDNDREDAVVVIVVCSFLNKPLSSAKTLTYNQDYDYFRITFDDNTSHDFYSRGIFDQGIKDKETGKVLTSDDIDAELILDYDSEELEESLTEKIEPIKIKADSGYIWDLKPSNYRKVEFPFACYAKIKGTDDDQYYPVKIKGYYESGFKRTNDDIIELKYMFRPDSPFVWFGDTNSSTFIDKYIHYRRDDKHKAEEVSVRPREIRDVLKYLKPVTREEMIEWVKKHWGEEALADPIDNVSLTEATDNRNDPHEHKDLGYFNRTRFSVDIYENTGNIYIHSSHPYDDADYSWARSKDGGKTFDIFRSGRILASIENSDKETYKDVINELIDLDKDVKPRMVYESATDKCTITIARDDAEKALRYADSEDEEIDFSWLTKEYNVSFDDVTDHKVVISGNCKDIDRFVKDHHLEDYNSYKKLDEAFDTVIEKINMLRRLASIRYNGAPYRGGRIPAAIDTCINQINIPDNMRLKSYDCDVLDSDLIRFKYITQEPFSEDDTETFFNEIQHAFTKYAELLGYDKSFIVSCEVIARDRKDYGYAVKSINITKQAHEAAQENAPSYQDYFMSEQLTEAKGTDIAKAPAELNAQTSEKLELAESYDEGNFTTITDVISNMSGNMSDDEFDDNLRSFNSYARALKIPAKKMVVYIDADSEYAPENYFNDYVKVRKAKFYDDFTTGSSFVISENINGRTWLYFKSKDDAVKYFAAIDSMNESFDQVGERTKLTKAELIRAIEKAADDDQINTQYVAIMPHSQPDYDFCIEAEIDRGDWKHDHIAFEDIVSRILTRNNYKYRSDSSVIDDTQSDTYSAIHRFYVKEKELEEKYEGPGLYKFSFARCEPTLTNDRNISAETCEIEEIPAIAIKSREEHDDYIRSQLGSNDTFGYSKKQRDLDEDIDVPYTRDEIFAQLDEIIRDSNSNNGHLKTFYEIEKDYALDYFREHDYEVEVSGEDLKSGERLYHIRYYKNN